MHVVIVSDEGDGSRLLATGDDDPAPYLEIFQQLDNDVVFTVIGPAYDAKTQSFDCNSGGATSWGTLRYQQAAQLTGGYYAAIEEEADGDCQPSDFGAILEGLAARL